MSATLLHQIAGAQEALALALRQLTTETGPDALNRAAELCKRAAALSTEAHRTLREGAQIARCEIDMIRMSAGPTFRFAPSFDTLPPDAAHRTPEAPP